MIIKKRYLKLLNFELEKKKVIIKTREKQLINIYN